MYACIFLFSPILFFEVGGGEGVGGPHFLSFMHIGNIALGA